MTLPVLRELEDRARAVLPPEVHAYFATGAGEGLSTAEAADAWRRHRLVPRVLMDVTDVDCGTTLLGTRVDTPIGVAPATLQRAATPDGEVATARAVARTGGLMVVSSNAGSRFEDIGATGAPWWLQVYVTADRTLSADVVQRALDAGARALVLTADTPVVARKPSPAADVWDLVEPDWVRANFQGPGGAGDALVEAAAEKARDLGPQDVAWLRSRFDVPVVVKGVLHPTDARRVVDAGADAVWVSNHGGRQLDRAVPTARALPSVVAGLAAAGTQVEVYVDGGIRSGLDALVARACGARAVFVARPVLWGLAAQGEEGVVAALGALRADLEESLALAGASAWDGVPADLLAPTTGPGV